MVSGRFSNTKEGLPKSEEFRLLGRLALNAFPWAAGSGLPHRQLCFFKTLGHTNRNFFVKRVQPHFFAISTALLQSSWKISHVKSSLFAIPASKSHFATTILRLGIWVCWRSL